MKNFASIDKYIAAFPEEVREILETVRATIKKAAPDATEAISYGIPTFKLNEKNLVHFAGYKNHIGFYPGAKAIEVFADDIEKYNTSKGTVQFPLGKKIPFTLIAKITRWRVKLEMSK